MVMILWDIKDLEMASLMRITKLRRMQFGRSSERITRQPDWLAGNFTTWPVSLASTMQPLPVRSAIARDGSGAKWLFRSVALACLFARALCAIVLVALGRAAAFGVLAALHHGRQPLRGPRGNGKGWIRCEVGIALRCAGLPVTE